MWLVSDNWRGVRRVSSNMDEGGIRGNRGWPKCSLRAGIFTRSRGQKQRGRSPSRISVASEEGWAQEGVTMSREPCARIVFYSLLHHHHHHRTSADTCAEGGKKRCSESILKGIHEYGCQGPSAPLPSTRNRAVSAFIFDYLAHSHPSSFLPSFSLI